jgi:DNA (cytosine-5)-methyltransferase 1
VRYLSICSGIEAATVAWAPLGWTPAAFAEIEPFACAVLGHHYPEVPNLGDMTAPDFCERARKLGRIDLIVGGTPCQAFSVAGLRRSLKDERGNLTLRFCEIIDELDPEWVVWENVPGVLSTEDNAFGCLLAGLVGDPEPILPGKKGWSNAGLAVGPRRAAAWRIQDAQYHRLAQRRRRVFVVVRRAGNGDGPAAVLFEPESLPRHSPPSREKGKGVARCVTASTGGCSGKEQQLTFVDGGGGEPLNAIAGTLSPGAHPGSYNGQDASNGMLVAHALRADGFDASEDGTGRGTPLVPVVSPILVRADSGLVYTVSCCTDPEMGERYHVEELSLCCSREGLAEMGIHIAQSPAPDQSVPLRAFNIIGCGQKGKNHAYETDVSGCLQHKGLAATGNEAGTLVAFSCKDYGADAGEIAPTPRAMHEQDGNANAGGQVAVAFHARQDPDLSGDVTHPVDTDGHTNGILTNVQMPDTLELQGIRRIQDANATEADARQVLRVLRQAIREEAFAEWGLAVSSALQSAEILRSDLHGEVADRDWSYPAPSESKQRKSEGEEEEVGRGLRGVRETERKGCTPSEREYRRQPTGESQKDLPVLPQQDASPEELLQGLRLTHEGAWILQQALAAIQEMGRSPQGEGQSIRPGTQGRSAEPAADMQGEGLRETLSCEWLLRAARTASTSRQALIATDNLIRKENPGSMAVRRLTPV